MDNKLFAPPRAWVADLEPPASDSLKPRAVWLVQGAAVLLIPVLFLAMAASISIAFWHESHPGWPFALAWCTAWGLLMFGAVLVSSGCQRRHPRGRRIGRVLIALLFLVAIAWAALDLWTNFFAPIGGRHFGLLSIAKDLLCWALVVSIGVWFHAFGYAAPARYWFGLATPGQSAQR